MKLEPPINWGPMLVRDQVAVVVAIGVPASMAAEADAEFLDATYGSAEDRLAAGDRIRARFERYLANRLRDRPEIRQQAISFGVTQLLSSCLDRVEERLMSGAPRVLEEPVHRLLH